MTYWKALTDSQVENHPLYGIGGWSILFFIFLLARIGGPIVGAGAIYSFNISIGRTDAPWIWGIVAVFFILWNLRAIYLFFKKDQQFKNSYIGLVVAGYVFNVLLALHQFSRIKNFWWFDLDEEAFVSQSVISLSMVLLINIALLAYVFRSRRMRVTFFHQVLSTDPILFESDHKKSEVVGQSPLNLPPSKKAEKVPTSSEKPLRDLNDDELYEIAWREAEENSRNEGLWARLFVENDGDENKTKASYTKVRADELLEQRKVERAKWEENERD